MILNLVTGSNGEWNCHLCCFHDSITHGFLDSNLFTKTRSFCLIFGPIVNSSREEAADGCSTQCRAEGAAVHSIVKKKRKTHISESIWRFDYNCLGSSVKQWVWAQYTGLVSWVIISTFHLGWKVWIGICSLVNGAPSALQWVLAAISCFFSAAVYYRTEKEAKQPCFGK